VNAPARRRRLWRATLLWAALTFVVWNAVFDRMVVVAGRRYVAHAVLADQNGWKLLIDEAMRPAVSRAFWTATAVASAIAASGVMAVRRSRTRSVD
jgi:hypothetical protein